MYRIQVYKIQAGRIYAVDYVSGRRLEIMATREVAVTEGCCIRYHALMDAQLCRTVA